VSTPPAYPFVPRTNAQLQPGQFWQIPLSDGRFACGRVLEIGGRGQRRSRTLFVAALLDWVGDSPPTSETIAGAQPFAIGIARVETTGEGGSAVVGIRPLADDGIEPPAQISSYWGIPFPRYRAERRFVQGDPPPDYEHRQVRSPLSPDMLPPSVTGRGQVQFDRLLTDADFQALADWMRRYPEMSLRAYGGYDGSIRDLEFLRHFPFLRRFRADALYDRLTSLDGLRHLPDEAVELGIGATKARLDLAVLGRFGGLESLFLEGQTKHLEVVSSLTALDDLTLRSITMPDLSLLLPLRRLRSLDLKLGGTRDLTLAPRVGELRYLELWLIRGLDDVSVVGRIPTLRSLFLQALRNVVRLPDLRGATSLHRVHLETMRGLRDLEPLTTAPALEQVVLIDMPQLTLDDLRPLRASPSLREATLALGSIRRNAEARTVLGLPAVETPFDWRAD
jgi:hypothetical protein